MLREEKKKGRKKEKFQLKVKSRNYNLRQY